MLGDVAFEMGVDPSTVSRLLRHPERSPGAKPDGTPPKRRRDRVWTNEMVRLAISAWWDVHGGPPTVMDWSPEQLRQRRYRARGAERLAAWNAGWIDPCGVRRRFPRAAKVPLRELIEQVAQDRHAVAG
jgi:hypothetical protein